MNIRTWFVLTMCVFGVLLIAGSVSLFLTGGKVARVSLKQQTAIGMQQAANELGYLATNYLLYGDPVQAARWESRFSSLLTDTESFIADDAEQRYVAGDIKQDSVRLQAVFNDVKSTIAANPQARTADVYFLQVSWSRLQVQSQTVMSSAERLTQLLHDEETGLWRANIDLIVALVAAMAASLIASYVLTYRRTLLSVAALQAGMDVVGSGNLNHIVPEKRNDEIGNLARSFNTMTMNLKNVTASRAELEKAMSARQAAEQELRESEAHYRLVFEGIQEAFIVQEIVRDASGAITDLRYIEVNPVAERSLGKNRADIIGRLRSEIQGPLDTAAAEIVRRVASGESVRQERYLEQTGRWLEIYSYAPQPGQVATLNLDITARKQAEADLVRINRELRAISDCNQALVRAADETALLEDVCRIMCDTAGYRMAWVGAIENDTARSVRHLAWGGVEDGYLAQARITWADTERGRGPTGMAARTGQTQFFQDFESETAAAPWREAALARGYRSSIAVPLKDQSGKPFAVFTLYAAQPNGFDTTEIRLIEELAGDLSFGINALRDRQERRRAESEMAHLASFPELNPNPVVELDMEGRVVYANPASQELFTDLMRRGNEHPLLAGWQQIRDSLRWETRDRVTREIMLGDAWYEQSISLDPAGRSIRIYAHDITERKLRDQLKDEFVGMVSHELKTPLTVIIGSIYTAMNENVPAEDAQELLASAAASSEELAGIVDNLLELSRAQAQRLKLDLGYVALQDVAALVAARLQRKSAVHTISINIPEDVQPLNADRIRVERIMHNLMENAIKYSPKGGEVKVFAQVEDGEVVVSVSDHGIGISPEDRARLFQSFERFGAYQTHTIPGLGLGLRVCRLLVEAHGGRIWVDSEPGKGSTFYFSLPTIQKAGPAGNHTPKR